MKLQKTYGPNIRSSTQVGLGSWERHVTPFRDHLCQYDLVAYEIPRKGRIAFTEATKEGNFQMEVGILVTSSLRRAEPLNWGLWREQGTCMS